MEKRAEKEKQQKQKEKEAMMQERKQTEYENRQYQKLLARRPPPPPPPPASLAYNWRSNCNPGGPPLDEDEYQPNYVDRCDPSYRYGRQPLSAPATVPVMSRESTGKVTQGDIQIGYDQASDVAPDVEMGC